MNWNIRLEDRIVQAVQSVELSNNGHAWIGYEDDLADAMRARGYEVIAAPNAHGRREWKAFTKKGQAALREEARQGSPFAVSTYKPVRPAQDRGPDYEELILRKQEEEGRFD